MKRLLPAPLMSVALFAMWLLLDSHPGVGTLVMAAIVALGMPLMTAPLRPKPLRVRRPQAALALLATVVADAIVSNLQIARSVWEPRTQPRSAFVRVPLDLVDANGLAMLAVITTVVPGTVWSELSADRTALLLHLFDVDDEAAFVARYKARYEQPLMEIFD